MKRTILTRDMAGATDRLSRLLHANARISQDVAKLPPGLTTEEAEAREAEIIVSLLGEFDITRDVWGEEAEEFAPEDIQLMLRGMHKWCAGRMEEDAASEFFASIDDEANVDWAYVFLGVPLKQLAPEDQKALTADVLAFGCRRASI
jgi:hypothetical protein